MGKFNLKRATLPNGDVRLIVDDDYDVLLSELREDCFPGKTDDEFEAIKAELLQKGRYRWKDPEQGRRDVRVPADFELDYMGVTDALIEKGRQAGDPKADFVADTLYGDSKLGKSR